jgi:hypothetical protein
VTEHNQDTRQIRVILYAKGALHGAPADELPIEDILTVKHTTALVSVVASMGSSEPGSDRFGD